MNWHLITATQSEKTKDTTYNLNRVQCSQLDVSVYWVNGVSIVTPFRKIKQYMTSIIYTDRHMKNKDWKTERQWLVKMTLRYVYHEELDIMPGMKTEKQHLRWWWWGEKLIYKIMIENTVPQWQLWYSALECFVL